MTTSFFRFANEDIVSKAIKFAEEHNKQFSYVIDGESIIEDAKDQVLECLSNSDVVFCHKYIAMACVQHMKEELGMLSESAHIVDIAKALSMYKT